MSLTNENEPAATSIPLSQEEQVPHSGVHFDEKPVEDFDNTSLQEAVDQGLLQPLPETIHPLDPVDEPTTRHRGRTLGIGAGALLLSGGIFFGISHANGGGEPKKPVRNPGMEAIDKGTEAYMKKVEALASKSAADDVEFANAKPEFAYVDSTNPNQPTIENVRTIYKDLQYGLIKGDAAFFRAAIGDELDTEPVTNGYLSSVQVLMEQKKLHTVTAYNFEFGPRTDVENPIVQDAYNPSVFYVKVTVRFFDNITNIDHVLVLNKSYSSEAGAETWNVHDIRTP